MLRILGFLIVTALLVAGAVWLADRPGSVVVNWLGWRVQTTVPVFLLAVLLLAAVAYGLLKLLRGIVRIPGRISEARRVSRQRKGLTALADGLAAVAAGDQRQAKRLARRADRLLDNPPLTTLLSAQAAQLSGDRDQARAHFTAMLDRPETTFAGLKGLMALAIEDGDQAAGLDYARRAHAMNPDADWLTATLFDLQVRQGLWREAQDTLAQGTRHGAFGAAEARRKKAVILNERAALAEAAGDLTDAGKLAQQAHNADPALTDASVRVARLYTSLGKARKAGGVIEESWEVEPHPDLLAAYQALVPDEDPLARVRRMEKLVKLNPAHALSHLAAGEAALQAKLWGQARAHLLGAAERQPTARTYTLLARVEEGEGHAPAARQWLEKAAEAPVDPAWACDQCGSGAAQWAALCPSCNSFDTLLWTAPAKPAVPVNP